MRTLLQHCAALLLACIPLAGQTQAYPSKPLKLIVPYAVGQCTDIAARYLGDEISKALGVTSAASSKLRPGVKSIAEQGVAGYELVGWTVFFAPKGLPPEAARTLAAAVNKTLERPEVQDKLLQLGIDPLAKTGDELKRFVATEKRKVGPTDQRRRTQTKLTLHTLT